MERRQLRCPGKIVEGAIQGAGATEVAGSTGGAVATDGAGVAEGAGAAEGTGASEGVRNSEGAGATEGTRDSKDAGAFESPRPPREPGPLRAPKPMTAPEPLRVLTAGVTEGAWPIWVVRGVIQGAEEPWMTPFTRAPYSLRLTGGTGQCTSWLRPCHGEIFVSLQCM